MRQAKRLGRGVPHVSRVDLRPLIRSRSASDTLVCGADGSVRFQSEKKDRAEFEVPGKCLARGWYMLEVEIESDQSFMDGAVQLLRSSTGRSRALRLPLRSGRLAKRLIWLRYPDEQLHFLPRSCDGAVTIRKLSLVRVSLPFALNRMAARLSRRYLPVPSRLVNRWVAYDLTFHPNGARVSYGEWLRRIEPGLWPERSAAGSATRFVVVVPALEVHQDISALTRTLESVFTQQQFNKDHYSACVLLDPGASEGFRAAVKAVVEGYPRATIEDLSAPVSLSRLLPTGAHAVVCPPNGAMAPEALRCFAEVVSQVPNARLIYSDEDSISPTGRRAAPRFKPGWNPDLLYSGNYVGDFFLLTDHCISELGFVDFSNPAWSLDLVLRVSRLAAKQDESILHTPRVLHHRFTEVKDVAGVSGDQERAVLDAHFAASGQEGVTIESDEAIGLRTVRWPVGDEPPLVSLLIPTRDMLPVLKLCVDSILENTTYPNYEILILDNQSKAPETLEYFIELEKQSNIRVLPFDAPFNYSAINNFGVRHARGSIIGLINNDVEVINPDWLDEMVGHVRREEVGCVGAKLFYSDGRIQHAGVVVGLGGLAGHVHKFLPGDAPGYMNRLQATQAFSAVTAACLLLRKSVFEAVGGLNERELQVAFNDVDLCLKVQKAGYRNIWTPHAKLYHHESISRGIDNTREKRARFERESTYLRKAWSEYLDNPGRDPYYSPFLTHVGEDFSLGLNEKRDIPLFR